MTNPYPGRIAKCGEHMRHLGIDVLLLMTICFVAGFRFG